MSVISRQFAKDILLSTIFVLIVLIALFAFFDLIGPVSYTHLTLPTIYSV